MGGQPRRDRSGRGGIIDECTTGSIRHHGDRLTDTVSYAWCSVTTPSLTESTPSPAKHSSPPSPLSPPVHELSSSVLARLLACLFMLYVA